jgi:putative oxidoreductase
MNYLNSIKRNPFIVDIVLLLVRVFVGFAMLSHGFPKLQQLLSGEQITFYNFLGMGQKSSLILTVFAEFVCSIFLILGLFTRFSLLFLIITMIVAAFLVHSADPFTDRETSLLYLSIYLLLMATGPSRFSIDAMISRQRDSAW